MKTLNKAVCSIAFLAALPMAAQAQAPEAYIGVGYGQYKFEFEDADTDFKDDQDLMKFFVGGKFNETFGVELSHLNFSDGGDEFLDTDIKGISLAGVLSAPISEYFSVFGKAGWFAWEADIESKSDIVDFSRSIDGNDFFYGAGLKFKLTDHADLRLEYDRYEIDDEIDPELDIVSFSAQYVF